MKFILILKNNYSTIKTMLFIITYASPIQYHQKYVTSTDVTIDIVDNNNDYRNFPAVDTFVNGSFVCEIT